MTCPITVRLGVYALGAADTAERELVESHLPSCPACRAELAHLEPLPGLLARVPAHLARTDPRSARPQRAPAARIIAAGTTPAGPSRASARRWRAAAAVAAAAALGGAGGIWIAQPTPNPAPAGVTLSGANPVTHVRVTVTLTRTSWGTSIRLRAWGLPLNQPCQLIVRSRGGGTEITGAWDAWRAGPVTIPASAAWRPADISSLQVATASRSLVTITAARTGTATRTASPRRARDDEAA
jgi:Putative zinc-finger